MCASLMELATQTTGASSVQSEHLSFVCPKHKLHQIETFATVVAEAEGAGLLSTLHADPRETL